MAEEIGLENQRRLTCLCVGFPAPGVICKHVVVANKYLCGAKDEDVNCKFRGEGCCECGAITKEEAEIKCLCDGDKDDCHGLHIWPD